MRLFTFLLFAVISFHPVLSEAQDIGTINFGFDSAALDAEATAKITEIADRLKTNPSYRPTVVVGHTDAVGSQGYNQQLGLRRARAVADALVAAGAPVGRIGTVESRGKNELLVRVSGPERSNRRVAVTLDDILAACRSWREISLTPTAIGTALNNDLTVRLGEAVAYFDHYANSGNNGPAFQMAGAAREDCGNAVGLRDNTVRKLEYAQRCLCSSARLRVAVPNR